MKRPIFPWIGSLLLVALFSAAAQGKDTGSSNTGSVVAVRSWFTVGDDGRNGQIAVAANIAEGYHVYGMSQPKPFIATRIRLERSPQVASVGQFQSSQPARVRVHDTLAVELHEHHGQVTWTAPVRLVAGASAESVEIAGRIRVQACTPDRCLAPVEIPFVAEYRPGVGGHVAQVAWPTEPAAGQPSAQATASGARAAPNGFELGELDVEAAHTAGLSVFVVLGAAFLAGFLLNFMPCVLPVIGLKLMSFVEQAGDSRRRALVLNLWYSLGLISVMMVLASLAVFAGIGWGEQFTSATFNVVLSSVVFVFALSFLGVWEIPLPGFVGTMAAGGMTQREGIGGALSKGVLTTVLATPCSGPLLGAALTWGVSQPAPLTYAVFATVGLGMASPYLLIGAFPRLVAFLPKPGAWMHTFKQAMGFVLLGTVIYLLSFISIPYVVPAGTLMLGLAVACWWIGRVSLVEPWPVRARAWLVAGAFSLLVGMIAFGWLDDVMTDRFHRAVDRELAGRQTRAASPDAVVFRQTTGLPWRPFSRLLFSRYIAQGKTVFVEFTADWCLTCKANEAVAINRPAVRRLVDQLGIVTLKADKTGPAPEADRLLSQLGNRAGSIPFYAIFPAGNPTKPIVLDGVFTSPERILDGLRRGGPSQSSPAEAVAETPDPSIQSVTSTQPSGEEAMSSSEPELRTERKVEHASEENFERQVLKSDVPALVDFYAEWCGPCRALAPTLEELARETFDAKIVKVNVDENPQLAAQYGVTSIPSLAVFKDGIVTARHVGLATKEQLRALLSQENL